MTPSPQQLKRQAPARRGKKLPLRLRLFLRLRWIGAALVAVAVLLVWASLARAFAPTGNTSATHFDAIIVLGSPGDPDGNPRPTQLARISEGVREYERGVAPRLILTGAAVDNRTVEAESMARVARAQGVPETAIFIEPQGRDTILNACYSARIMKAHGWRSAEVVSSDYHLGRAGMIFGHVDMDWRVHVAPPVEPESAGDTRFHAAYEVLKTARYLVLTQWAESCTP